MRTSTLVFIGGALAFAAGVVLAVAACDPSGYVINDSLHRDFMRAGTVLSIAGLFSMFFGTIFRGWGE